MVVDAEGQLYSLGMMREFMSMVLAGAYMPLTQVEREAYYEGLKLASEHSWSSAQLAAAHHHFLPQKEQ